MCRSATCWTPTFEGTEECIDSWTDFALLDRGKASRADQPTSKERPSQTEWYSMRRNIRIVFFAMALLSPRCSPSYAETSQDQSVEQLLDDAEKNYQERNFEYAVDSFQKVIAIDPVNLEAHHGLVRSHLKQDDFLKAYEFARKGMELDFKNALSRVLLGDVYFKMAEFRKATAAYLLATHLDDSLSRAYLGLGQIYLSESNYRSAKKNLQRAYELDPDDPDVLGAWFDVQTGFGEYISLGKRYLESTNHDDPDRVESSRSYLQFLEELGHLRIYALQGEPRPTKIKLDKLRTNVKYPPHGVSVRASINWGKRIKLHLDTGASGILIDERTAQKNNITSLASSRALGVGDAGAREGFLGWAETVQIGALEFKDCWIQVVKNVSFSSDLRGVIGTDVFDRFLIKINYRRHLLELSPLPELDGVPSDWFPHRFSFNRSVPAGFTPVRRIGGKLLLKTQVDEVGGYFLIDTGSSDNFVSTDVAELVTFVRDEERFPGGGPIRKGARRLNVTQGHSALRPIQTAKPKHLDVRFWINVQGDGNESERVAWAPYAVPIFALNQFTEMAR